MQCTDTLTQDSLDQDTLAPSDWCHHQTGAKVSGRPRDSYVNAAKHKA